MCDARVLARKLLAGRYQILPIVLTQPLLTQNACSGRLCKVAIGTAVSSPMIFDRNITEAPFTSNAYQNATAMIITWKKAFKESVISNNPRQEPITLVSCSRGNNNISYSTLEKFE